VNKSSVLSYLSSALILSACATTQAGLSAETHLALPLARVAEAWQVKPEPKPNTSPISFTGWLTELDDITLNDLVERAYIQNPDLKKLRSRLDRSTALATKSRAQLSPFVNASIGASRTSFLKELSQDTASVDAGLDVSWAPDLWGRLDDRDKAAELGEKAAATDLEAGRQLLAANIAENYFLAIEANRLADVSSRNLDALNKTLGFVLVQYERGLRSGQDISLIRADVASARVSLNRAEGDARNALRRLEVLTGDYPKADKLSSTSLPTLPALDVIGKPADLLTQRPDLQAAQFRVRVAFRTHEASRKAKLPDLSLSGRLGGQSNVLGQIFNPTSIASTLLASVTAPIFDGGARKADISIAQSNIDEALADYQDLALQAFRDVEQQLDQGHILSDQELSLEQALESANKALQFTEFRYESAETDLLNVLSVQQRVSFIEAQLVSTRRARLVQYVNLALATAVEPL
jgi:NodT family efflux transporter outer membrane factor (OMF) lipoprotein